MFIPTAEEREKMIKHTKEIMRVLETQDREKDDKKKAPARLDKPKSLTVRKLA